MGLFTKTDWRSALMSTILGLLCSLTLEPWLKEKLPSLHGAQAPEKATVTLSEEPQQQPEPQPAPPPSSPPTEKPTEEPEPQGPEDPEPEFLETIEPLPGLIAVKKRAEGTHGEVAHLEITVLDAEHYWPIGRADAVMTPGDKEEDIFRFLDSSGLQKRIEKALDIIAIGMASCELELTSNQIKEENRAADRSNQLISWARRIKALPATTELYTINLGRFEDPACSGKNSHDTRHQRSTVLISVTYKKNIPNPTELLSLIKTSLQDEKRLGIDPTKYSLFSEFRWKKHT